MTEQFKGSVLVIVAHPDDPEFGCGGSIARWVEAGREVRYVLCTSGDKGSWDPAISPGQMAAVREQEQMEAAAELGVRECIFLRHLDGEVEASLAMRREISMLLRQYRPQTVVTHDPYLHYQLHPDHRAVGTVVMDAIAAARDIGYFPEQLNEEISAHRVKDLLLFRPQEVNYWVDISPTYERKVAALRRHASQVGRIENLEERMRERAQSAAQGSEYELAESFQRVLLP